MHLFNPITRYYTNHTTRFSRVVKHHAARALVYLGLAQCLGPRVSLFDYQGNQHNSPIWEILMPFCRSRNIEKHVFRRFLCKLYLTCVNVCWSSLGTVNFAWLVGVWASRGTTLLRTIFRAVSERFFKSIYI